jgi:hypothetical protein
VEEVGIPAVQLLAFFHEVLEVPFQLVCAVPAFKIKIKKQQSRQYE